MHFKYDTKRERFMSDVMGVLFLVILAVISYTDIRRRQIPNWCCGCIAALAVISDAVFFSAEIFDFEICQKLAFSEIFAVSLTERMLGALCVSVPMLGITVLAPGSFGGGDVKFMCAAGALLGWRHILWSAAAGIFSAGVYVLYLLIIKNTGRKAEFPLGPFLCLGIAVNILTEIY